MGTSKAGFVLSMIGGIIGVVLGLLTTIFSLPLFENVQKFGGSPSKEFLLPMFIVGLYILITAIIVIITSRWLKNPEKCFNGGLICLILGLFGGGTILSFIGGILGIVQAKKVEVVEVPEEVPTN